MEVRGVFIHNGVLFLLRQSLGLHGLDVLLELLPLLLFKFLQLALKQPLILACKWCDLARNIGIEKEMDSPLVSGLNSPNLFLSLKFALMGLSDILL